MILLPNGKPAGGGKAILITPSQGGYIRNCKEIHNRSCPTITTKADGKYHFPAQVDPWGIVVLHDDGYRNFSEADYKKGNDIKLQPWGRIEGKLLVGSKPGANERVVVQLVDNSRDQNQPRIHHDIRSSTDETGAFVFDRLPPGEAIVGRFVEIREHTWSTRQNERVNIESGKTLQVQLGGKGRPVIGRFVKPAGRDDLNFASNQAYFSTTIDLERNVPKPPARPENWESLDQATKAAWTDEYKNWRKEVEKWLETEEGKAYQKAGRGSESKPETLQSSRSNPTEPSWQKDVPAGAYNLRAYLMSGDPSKPKGQGDSPSWADFTHDFIVPEMPGGRSDEPLDLGRLELKAREQIVSSASAGQRVAAKAKPEKTLIGQALPGLKEFQFAAQPDIDQAGAVLVCFWDMEQRPSRHCIQELAKMSGKLAEKNVTVIAVNTSAVDKKQLEAWLGKNSIKLPVGQVSGDIRNTLSTWQVRKQPWLILTDKEHVVRAVGLPLAEVEGKIKETTK